MSNLIKSTYYVPIQDKKKLEAVVPAVDAQAQETQRPAVSYNDLPAEIKQEIEELKQSLIREAEEAAQAVLDQAKLEAEQLKAAASEEIEAWWQEHRQRDQHIIDEMKSQGYAEGVQEGKQAAKEQIVREYESQIQDANKLLQAAYDHKRRIIAEAEPFLIEVSTMIAEKILKRKLSEDPRLSIELIRPLLERSRQQGSVLLSVSPSQYSAIYEARDELRQCIEPQAELEILPDAAVEDGICIVRTSFGSMDARISTQLEEIKQALQQAAVYSVAEDEQDDSA
ncbi:FliH/SctL family protein [Marinicrinis lubricantis]|uniref:FliH/SctL family protein n=1 Tax=Marinicrinis lubricantis TaxID=2086470 RepID=A0ABW1IME8_9BACL